MPRKEELRLALCITVGFRSLEFHPILPCTRNRREHGQFPGLNAIRKDASAGPFSQILSHVPTTSSLNAQTSAEEGDKNADGAPAINFAQQMKQFEQVQQQHRLQRVASWKIQALREGGDSNPTINNLDVKKRDSRPGCLITSIAVTAPMFTTIRASRSSHVT